MHCITFLAKAIQLCKHGKLLKTAIVSFSELQQNPQVKRFNFVPKGHIYLFIFINLSNSHWVADHEQDVNDLLRA